MKKKLEKATEEEGVTHIHNNYSIFKLSGRVAATFFITSKKGASYALYFKGLCYEIFL
jgi:hypothetical protein